MEMKPKADKKMLFFPNNGWRKHFSPRRVGKIHFCSFSGYSKSVDKAVFHFGFLFDNQCMVFISVRDLLKLKIYTPKSERCP